MGAENTKIEVTTVDGNLPPALNTVLVVLTVPHAKCPTNDPLDEVDFNEASPDRLIQAAEALDRVSYGRQLRDCDRRALQAALLLRAQIVKLYPRARVVIFSNTQQPRVTCDSNRRQQCNLEARVRASMPELLRENTGRRINIDVHSFPTKGMVGDVLQRGDRRNYYFLTNSGAEVAETSLRGVAVERRGSAENLFLTLFPGTYNIPSVLLEFCEDKGEYPLAALKRDVQMLADWAMLEFAIMGSHNGRK